MKSNSFDRLVKITFLGQLWVFAISCLTSFFTGLLPFVVLLTESDTIPKWRQEWKALSYLFPWMETMWQGQMPFFFLAMIALGGLTGLAHHSYLHSARQVDLYHSLPVSRGRLFMARFVCALLDFLPAVLAFLLVMGIYALRGRLFLRLGAAFLIHLLAAFVSYLLSYLTASLAMLLTGQILIGVLGCGVFFFLFPLLHEAYGLGKELFYATVSRFAPGPAWSLRDLSPLLGGLHALKELPYRRGFLILGLYGVACLLLLALCLFALKKRPSEAAGKAIAFPWLEVLLKVILTASASFIQGILIVSIVRHWAMDLFLVAGCLLGGLWVYVLIELLFTRDIHKVLRKKAPLLLSLLLSGLALFALRTDLRGFDSYLPPKEEIQDVGLTAETLTMIGGGEALKNIHLPCDEKMYGVLRRLVETQQEEKKDPTMGFDFFTTNLCLHLKNGKDVYRTYTLPGSKIRKEMSFLYDLEAYRDEVYQIARMDESLVLDITLGLSTRGLTAEERSGFLAALREDYTGLTSETVLQEYPVQKVDYWVKRSGQRELTKEEELWLRLDEQDRTFSDYGVLYLYPSFTHTLAFLESLGIHPSMGPGAEQIQEILLYEMPDSGWEKGTETLIDDEKEIERIAPYLRWMTLSTCWQEIQNGVTATVTLKTDDWSEGCYLLPFDESNTASPGKEE